MCIRDRFHVGGGTLHKSNPRKTFLNYRNNLVMIYKNMPAAQTTRVILARLVLDGISSIRFMMAGAWPDVGAIIRAHFAFYRLVPKLKKIKKNPQSRVKLYSRSVVSVSYTHLDVYKRQVSTTLPVEVNGNKLDAVTISKVEARADGSVGLTYKGVEGIESEVLVKTGAGALSLIHI